MKGGEYQVPSNEVLTLAKTSSCSAYDCEFVALAKGIETPLITTDKKLIKAFPSVVTHLKNFIS
ncbi:MAG: type II toxin-antitoxin system VapC family toxin [Desulfobacteraceae bacterium]|nr:type II toxin-antitoxin system VapC family toxin [Desulfobacteraceae bacterium]